MKTLTIRINFTWDDEDDLWQFKLIVPNNVTTECVEEILIKEHNYLCDEDDTDLYGNVGRCSVTLLDYICEKYGWKLVDNDFDIDLNLN